MFNFNIFSAIFKNKKNTNEGESSEELKSARLMAYVKSKYPNYSNSDYINLMAKERERLQNITRY